MNHHESIKKEVILAATLLILGSAVTLIISGNNVFAKNTQAASPENLSSVPFFIFLFVL
jgi:hypothetical protein